MVWVHHEGEFAKRLSFNEVPENELIETITCGLGCVLIKRNVLEKVKFRYDKEKSPWDDVWFCEDARKEGFKVYLDTGVRCKHYTKGMDWSKIKR